MLKVEWPKVYYGKNGWSFTCVLDGKLIERPMSKRDAMGLAKSVLAAGEAEAMPEDLAEWDRRVAC
jgi:hypothetical protein